MVIAPDSRAGIDLASMPVINGNKKPALVSGPVLLLAWFSCQVGGANLALRILNRA